MQENLTNQSTIWIKLTSTGNVIGGYFKAKKKHRRNPGRTSHTYNNKLVRLQAKYRKLSKSSKKFIDRFPSFESFLQVNPLKEVRREGTTINPVGNSTVIKKGQKSAWGI